MREVRAVKYAYKKRVAQAVARNYKHFWAYVQSRTTTNETITRMKMVNRDIIEDDRIIAQEMNQVLNGVYVREDTGQPTLDLDSVFQGSKLQEILINRECIRKTLERLNGNKAHEPECHLWCSRNAWTGAGQTYLSSTKRPLKYTVDDRMCINIIWIVKRFSTEFPITDFSN